jgi:hypothetical protein
MLFFRWALVMIFSGALPPKSMADTFVVSENVGEGGPAGAGLLEVVEMINERRERVPGMTALTTKLEAGRE